MRSLVIATHMMGRASASVLATRGTSASSGRRPTTRATRSRTSLAAASISRERWKVMLTLEDSSRLVDSIVLMPSIPAIASSMIWVTWVSMICAEAPR